MENRDSDKKLKFCKENSRQTISLDQIKSLYIASGMSSEEISKETFLSKQKVDLIIEENNLSDLRKAYVREGISKIQNVQMYQAQRVLDIEVGFKKLKLLQLEDKLKDYMAYYARHGDLYKRHPVSGEILKNVDGIPMQLNVPSIYKEISQIKESVTLSEGIKKIMSDIDSILNSKTNTERVEYKDEDIIDMEQIDNLFKKRD